MHTVERTIHRHPFEVRLGIFSIALLALIALASYDWPKEEVHVIIPPSAHREEINHGNTSKKQVIFTFDGGAGAGSSEEILAALAKHHVRGTFFLTGKFVEKNPEIVRQMVIAGHEVHNHTFDHPHLTELSDEEIITELNGMDQRFASTTEGLVANKGDIIKQTTKPYFRPPYGDRDERVLDAAYKAGYQSVYWTVDAMDWLERGSSEREAETAQSVRDRVLAHVAPGTIYLMHVGDSITGAILDDLFTTIEAQGYTPVSLGEGL